MSALPPPTRSRAPQRSGRTDRSDCGVILPTDRRLGKLQDRPARAAKRRQKSAAQSPVCRRIAMISILFLPSWHSGCPVGPALFQQIAPALAAKIRRIVAMMQQGLARSRRLPERPRRRIIRGLRIFHPSPSLGERMKLVRFGPAGREKPGIIDSSGRIRDLSGIVPDIAGDALGPRGLAKI